MCGETYRGELVTTKHDKREKDTKHAKRSRKKPRRSVAPQKNSDILVPRPLAEGAANQSEQLFRSIFENAQIGISFFSIAGRAIFTNRAFQEMLGYSEQELSRLEHWDKIIHPDERASGSARYAELVQGKRDRDEWEQRLLRRDGSVVIANARFSVLRDAAGKPQYVTSLTEDITERKRAQEERSRVTRRMEMLLESTGQGLYGIDLKGNCTFINRATCDMVGYRPEEALGRNMHELVHHHKPDGSFYPVDECPIYRAFRKGAGCRLDTEVIWRSDGTPIAVEYSSFPIVENGKITGAVVTVADITERKHAEEKVRASEQLFRSIFENAQIGIGVFKIDRQELSPNRALQEMLGYSEKELGRLETWDEITHPEESALDAQRYGELVVGKRDKDEWEQRLIRRDGRIVVTRVRFSVLRDAGGGRSTWLRCRRILRSGERRRTRCGNATKNFAARIFWRIRRWSFPKPATGTSRWTAPVGTTPRRAGLLFSAICLAPITVTGSTKCSVTRARATKLRPRPRARR